MEDLQQKVVPTQKKSENNNKKQTNLCLGAFDKVLIQCETPSLNARTHAIAINVTVQLQLIIYIFVTLFLQNFDYMLFDIWINYKSVQNAHVRPEGDS